MKSKTETPPYENKALKISTRMALLMSVLLPLAETIRRINQVGELRELFSWFDDYLLGLILFLAAFSVLKKNKNAIAYLIAAWGIATGALFLSFLGQFKYLELGQADPGIFSAGFVAVIKGLILMYMLVGMQLSIKSNEN